MKLSNKGRYGVRAIFDIAFHSGGKATQIKDISRRQAIPPRFLEQIFQDLGFSDFDTSGIQGEHKEWEYCVQYRETDFNFITRLMEQEGIFFWFEHEDGKHTMKLTLYRETTSRSGYRGRKKTTTTISSDEEARLEFEVEAGATYRLGFATSAGRWRPTIWKRRDAGS